VSDSKCNDDKPDNCIKYGRLYDWSTAMTLPTKCNMIYCDSQISAKHRGICPSGWHIPNIDEWLTLMDFVDPIGTETGTKLKATSGWLVIDGFSTGTDDFGFSALPGGYGNSSVSLSGNWWSASEERPSKVYYLSMSALTSYLSVDRGDKSDLFSVRCLKD